MCEQVAYIYYKCDIIVSQESESIINFKWFYI